MNDTERAIKTFESLTLCGICTGSENGCTKCDRYNAKIQALAALQEKAEREKGCAECHDAGMVRLYWDKGYGYCPHCGKKLEEQK